MLRIQYSHLCEMAFLSQNGNLNLIGIFEKVNCQNFPMVFSRLSIVTALEGKGGDYEMLIKILNKKTNEEVVSPILIRIKIDPKKMPNGEPEHLRIIGEINNLVFKEPGDFEVQILLKGEPIYRIPFSVQKALKPIPEGR